MFILCIIKISYCKRYLNLVEWLGVYVENTAAVVVADADYGTFAAAAAAAADAATDAAADDDDSVVMLLLILLLIMSMLATAPMVMMMMMMIMMTTTKVLKMTMLMLMMMALTTKNGTLYERFLCHLCKIKYLNLMYVLPFNKN